MPNRLLRKTGVFFEILEQQWEKLSTQRRVAYPVVFRYFGFAVATVFIRLALTAPRVVDAALGVVATVFAIALTWVYNRTTSGEFESPT